MGRQREKERLLCGQPVCEEVGRAPVASQWASVNHMAPSLSPSSSPSLPLTLFFFPSSLRWKAGHRCSAPSLLLTTGIIISLTHTLQTHGNILIKPHWPHTTKSHTHMHISHTLNTHVSRLRHLAQPIYLVVQQRKGAFLHTFSISNPNLCFLIISSFCNPRKTKILILLFYVVHFLLLLLLLFFQHSLKQTIKKTQGH